MTPSSERESSKTSQSYGRGYNRGSIGRAQQASEDDRPFAEVRKNLHDIWRIISLHRWMFFVPFCVVTSGAFIASLYYPRTYRATTSFERRNDPIMMNLPMSAGAASFKYFRNTMVRDLTSVECLAEVVEKLGLVKNLERDADGELTPNSKRHRDSIARSLGGTLGISTSSPSELMDVIRVTYTGPDPTIGKKLVDQVKRTYIRRTMVWIHDYLVSQRDYFQREADEASVELKRAHRRETELRLDNPHMNPNDPGAISLKLSQLEIERRELQLRRREYEAELSAQRQLLAAIEPEQVQSDEGPRAEGSGHVAGPPDPMVLQLQEQLAVLNGRLREFRNSRGMTDQHPDVQEVMQSRSRIEERLTSLGVPMTPMSAATAPLYAASPDGRDSGALVRQWQSDRTRLLVQIATQEGKIKDVTISLQTNDHATSQIQLAKQQIFQKQEEFAEVMGAVAKARQAYSRHELTVAEIVPAIKAIEQDRLMKFSEGSPARGSSSPISPKAPSIVLLAILAGAAAGAVFVILAELIDNVFRGSAQVSRNLGIPILEAIDEIVTGQDRRRKLIQRAVVSPVIILICLGTTGLTGSMAYLSIRQPWTYQKIRNIPQAALELFVNISEDTSD